MEKIKLVALLYFIGFVDLFGVSMMIGILIKAIRSKGVSSSLVGVIDSLNGALQMFSGPLMGALSDMYDRRTCLQMAYIVPAIGYLLIGISSSLPLTVIARVLTGIFQHGLSISKAYLATITPPTNHANVLGLFNSFSSFGFIIGPLIGGYLADIDPTLSLPFYATSFVFMINSFLVTLLIPATSNKPLIQSINFHKLLSSVNILSGINWRRRSDLLLYQFISSLAVITFRINLPTFLQEQFKLDRYSYLGMIMSLGGVISAFASAFAGKLTKMYASQKTLLVHGTLLVTLSLCVGSWSPWLPLTVVCLVPLSFATSNLKICTLKLMLSRGGSDVSGAIIGMGNSVSSLGRAVGPSIVGVAQEVSSQASCNVSIVIALSAIILSFCVST